MTFLLERLQLEISIRRSTGRPSRQLGPSAFDGVTHVVPETPYGHEVNERVVQALRLCEQRRGHGEPGRKRGHSSDVEQTENRVGSPRY